MMIRIAPFLVLFAALPAAAQAPAYGRNPADTLRYREVRETTIRVEGEDEPQAHRRNAEIVLWFTQGDTARARYGSLEMYAENEVGHERVEVPGTAMRGRFALAVSPAGRVRTLQVQRFPEEAAMDWDTVAEWQFADFLPTLPAEPLRPGLAWTDADSFDVESRAGPRMRWTRSTRYRVAGDTVVDGRAAVIVQTEADVGLRYDTKHWALLHAELRGTERGRFVFAPEPGLLLRRERTGRMEGSVRLNQQGMPARTLSQTHDYTVSIELLSAR